MVCRYVAFFMVSLLLPLGVAGCDFPQPDPGPWEELGELVDDGDMDFDDFVDWLQDHFGDGD